MDYDADGREILKCGFKIGGGIDQNFKKSPQGYTDNVNTLLHTQNIIIFVLHICSIPNEWVFLIIFFTYFSRAFM